METAAAAWHYYYYLEQQSWLHTAQKASKEFVVLLRLQYPGLSVRPSVISHARKNNSKHTMTCLLGNELVSRTVLHTTASQLTSKKIPLKLVPIFYALCSEVVKIPFFSFENKGAGRSEKTRTKMVFVMSVKVMSFVL